MRKKFGLEQTLDGHTHSAAGKLEAQLLKNVSTLFRSSLCPIFPKFGTDLIESNTSGIIEYTVLMDRYLLQKLHRTLFDSSCLFLMSDWMASMAGWQASWKARMPYAIAILSQLTAGTSTYEMADVSSENMDTHVSTAHNITTDVEVTETHLQQNRTVKTQAKT